VARSTAQELEAQAKRQKTDLLLSLQSISFPKHTHLYRFNLKREKLGIEPSAEKVAVCNVESVMPGITPDTVHFSFLVPVPEFLLED